jgi:hypothetical protein
MADFNPSVALDVKPPDIDISKPLNALANIRMSNARSNLYSQQAQLQAMKINYLQQYGQALSNGDENSIQDAIANVGIADPDAANALQKVHQNMRVAKAGIAFSQNPSDTSVFNPFPDVKQTVVDTLSKADANSRANMAARMEVGGAAAEGYLNNPSMDTWNAGVDMMAKSGQYSKEETDALRNQPNSVKAAQMRAASTAAKDFMAASGETSAAQTRDLTPQASVYTPPGVRTPSGVVPPAVPAQPTLAPTPNQPAAGTQSGQSTIENDPRYKEIPNVNVDQAGATPQPGIVHQGANPQILEAKTASIEHYNKDIVPTVQASQKQQSELGALRSQFQSGKITPGKTAELRATIAGYLYEATGHNLELTRQLTGIDPSAADVANKTSTRLGFDMSREQGAREAVQVIQFAMSANPNMLNTKEGALKLIGLLDNAAQWNLDRADYAGKYLLKNGHLIGFDQWHQQNHPLDEQTSKAVPYQVPPGSKPTDMKDKATYEFPQRDAAGKTVLDKNGQPVMQQGVWDANAQHFMPVQ